MPTTRLFVPMARAALLQHGRGENGAPLCTLYHRGKDVSWDDPRHFGFAQALLRCPDFTAAEVAAWGGVDWDEAASMLADLIEAGVVAHHTGIAEPRHDHQPMPRPLPPGPMARPRSWMDPSSLMAELTGRELDLAWLETVVPVFRTGHLFVDRDGRQVGEANAFPAAARLDVPTDWRGCPYAGTRYQAEKPMNATALKAMRRHWRQMMGLLLAMRSAWLARFPLGSAGWTIGQVERLTVSVLALPSVLMLDCADAVPNGDLHPVLSNLFRVTDGLRMVVHQMLFLPVHEAMRHPDEPVDAAEILTYADRNHAFHSDHGVCAGPRFMIEDFLGVLLDGAEPRGGLESAVDPELIPAIARMDQAIDYAMLGLETYATVFSLWPAMARCYEALGQVLAAGATSVPAEAMAQRFAGHFEALSHRSFLASEAWRLHRIAVYDDMHAAAHAATTGHTPDQPLSVRLASIADEDANVAHANLLAACVAHFGVGQTELATAIADVVIDFLRHARLIVRAAEQVQQRIARLLARPDPIARLTLADLNLHNVLMGEDRRAVPFLPDELGRLFDLAIHVDADIIAIVARPFAGASTHSPGFGSGG